MAFPTAVFNVISYVIGLKKIYSAFFVSGESGIDIMYNVPWGIAIRSMLLFGQVTCIDNAVRIK
jgi:hypothetical protein